MSARFNTLDEWLEWQESLHWTSIDLGLKRLREVAERMQLLTTPFTLITVGGTNGKGSTVAMLEAILIEEGYRTGSYTSPYLYRYNERIKLSGEDSEDTLICAAFEAIDKAREADGARGESISLTYFEFATLAAIWIFKQKQVQVAIMEVGMGGRLDAVNLWDADVAI
ncbi:MAG: bifunctional folylpolyglutamate synthase/dihydrofolate synthase, partial [Thiotrichaceae bacterium]